MQLVIDIPEGIYESCKKECDENDSLIIDTFTHAIGNGVPLSKGHGRIIDESRITRIYYHIETHENERYRLEHIVIDGTDAPTIIDADKEEE